jgi:patatin-like phospholipase/acyl hydrolase
LALDGGGARGLFTAALLAAAEEDLNVRVADHFDLVAGTSTGGIIALGLGLGMSPRELVEFYVRYSPQVFSGRRLRSVQQWLYRKYDPASLTNAVRKTFGDRRFGESAKRLVIPSYELGSDDVYVFRTAHAPNLKRDYKLPAWQIALATAAAPTFFPAFRGIDRLRLIDGGVWANNPAMVALVEAFGPLGVPLEDIHMLSIGTYEGISGRPRLLNGGGRLLWATKATDVILRAGSLGVNNQARFFLKDRFLRLDPKVPAKEVVLDRGDGADDLIGRARFYSRKAMPEIYDGFMKHTAQSFQPLYLPQP